MTYTALVVVAVLAAVTLDLAVLRTRLISTANFWLAYAIMLFFQLILNGALTGLKIVSYDPGTIIGWRVAFAPVEDIGFGFALILLTLAAWIKISSSTGASPDSG